MKVRKTSKTATSKQRARRIARQDAEIVDLNAQLATALQRIDKLVQENARLKQQLAALDLTVRVHEILDKDSIVSIGDLAQKLEKDKQGLMALEGFGPKSLEEVDSKLAEARESYFAEAAK